MRRECSSQPGTRNTVRGRRVVAVLAAVGLLAVGVVGCQSVDHSKGGSASPTSSEPSARASATAVRPAEVKGIPTSPGTHALRLDVGGIAPRDYHLHLPPTDAWKGWRSDGRPLRRLPLIVALHGGLSTGAAFEGLTGFDALADAHGALVAYPEGWMTTWNAGDCCGLAKWTNTDDVGFLTKLIDKLVGTGLVDPGRVYATGFSNGAGMAYRLACESSGRLAAIGVVEGALVTPCQPDRRVSVIVFHGTADPIVPYGGGGTRNAPTDMRPFPPVSASIDFWRKADGLGATLRSRAAPLNARASGPIDCASTGKDSQGAEVALCTVKGGGHDWQGTDLQWAFFASHPRPN